MRARNPDFACRHAAWVRRNGMGCQVRCVRGDANAAPSGRRAPGGYRSVSEGAESEDAGPLQPASIKLVDGVGLAFGCMHRMVRVTRRRSVMRKGREGPQDMDGGQGSHCRGRDGHRVLHYLELPCDNAHWGGRRRGSMRILAQGNVKGHGSPITAAYVQFRASVPPAMSAEPADGNHHQNDEARRAGSDALPGSRNATGGKGIGRKWDKETQRHERQHECP